MIFQNWHKLSKLQRGAAIVFIGTFIVGGGLTVASYALTAGLKLPFNFPIDILLWPRAALAGYSDANTEKWIQIGGWLGLLPAFLVLIGILKSRPKIALHGDAAFAKEKEIAAAGMRSKKGLIAGFTGSLPSPYYGKPVNKMGGLDEENGKVKVHKKGHLTAKNLLMYGGPEHMLLYAPTRSGKGVGVVVPNLLNWPDSAVVLDIKKENWQLTSGFRKSGGQDVFLFDPLDPEGRTHRWNPLSTVRRGTEFQIEDLQRLADLFIPVASKDPFFDRAAQTAFVGVGGYLAETPSLPFTLGELYRQLTLTPNFVATFKKRIKDRADEGKPLSIQTVSTLNDFLSKSENTFESVKSTITANLGLFANPMLDRATATSDFDFADLRKKRMTIYVGITPNNLGRLASLLNLFFQSCVDANMQELPENNPALKHRVLLCMDEFAAVGELPAFKRGIGYFAGYGLKVLTIVQTPAQLADIYGQDGAEAYMDNAGISIVFTPKSLKEARNLSERLGTHGATAASESKSKYLAKRENTTISRSEQKRSLMMPQELLQMDQSDAIVLAAGHAPIKGKKIRFYAEEVFLERSRIAPPIIPALGQAQVTEDVRELKADNRRLREDVEDLKDTVRRLTTLKNFHAENVANGEPSEVPMTDEEIANPGGISFDRLSLSNGDVQQKIQGLNKSGKIGTAEGAREVLAALGVSVPEVQVERKANA